MFKRNNKDKAATRKKNSVLSKFEIFYELTLKKPYSSYRVGRPKPWYVRSFKAVINRVASFFVDLSTAVRSIIRKVM